MATFTKCFAILLSVSIIQAQHAVITENYRAWKSCINSDSPKNKCDVIYDNALRHSDIVVRLKHYHDEVEELSRFFEYCMLGEKSKNECILEQQIRDIQLHAMKEELFPAWKNYELCNVYLPKNICYDFVMCLDSAPATSTEYCKAEAMAIYADLNKPTPEQEFLKSCDEDVKKSHGQDSIPLRKECVVYFEENLLKKQDMVYQLKYYCHLEHEIIDSTTDLTSASEEYISELQDKEGKIRKMKSELYPWLDIHKLCMLMNISTNTCYELVEEYQSPQHKNLEAAETYLCMMSGKTDEHCKVEVLEKKQKDEL